MHPKTRAKYGEITKTILKLVASGALTSLVGLNLDPSKTHRAISGLSDYSEEQIKRCLAHLRMQKYIKYSVTDIKSPLIITKRGLSRLDSRTVKDKIIGIVKKRWDHLWRIVVFDVPETKKYYRDQFREGLYKLGFFPYQKSMYVTPFACEDIIRDLARKNYIAKYVLISVTPNLGWRESYAINWFINDIKM